MFIKEGRGRVEKSILIYNISALIWAAASNLFVIDQAFCDVIFQSNFERNVYRRYVVCFKKMGWLFNDSLVDSN